MSEAQEKQTILGLVTRFFTIPLIIVVICLGVFYLFGRMAYQKKFIEDYLTEIKTGSSSQRWQAAYELSKKVAQEKVRKEYGGKIVAQLSDIYERELDETDPRLRQYVILCLAQLGDLGALPLFEKALNDSSQDVVIYALWGLGALKEPQLAQKVLPYLKHSDSSLRSVAAYVLGMIGNLEGVPALKEALKDSVPDVQWNAALALAQLNDDSGKLILHQLLDPTYLNQFKEMSQAQKENVLENAVKGVVLLKDKSALPLLEQLANTDQTPPVLAQIRKAIDTLR